MYRLLTFVWVLLDCLSSVLVTEDSTWDSCYEIIRTDNGFSNSGMHTTTSTLATVYWYAALIKI